MLEDNIDVERIERRLDAIWEVGRTSDGGVTRLAYTEEEAAAIEYVLDEVDDSLSVRTDSIGNVFVTPDPDAERSFFLGSHLDTVFNGGRLDGALGVVTALEALEAVGAAAEEPPVPPTLTIFRGEESSRFGQHTVGSRGALGLLTVEEFSAVDDQNVPLWQAIQQAGFRPDNLAEPTVDLDRVGGFLELHIEQGRVLDETGEDTGIVSSIRAPVRYEVRVEGDDDHSGATPMEMRRDAVTAAADMIVDIEEFARKHAAEGDLVATVGDVTAHQGAINKVCGTVTFPVDIRSNDAAYRDSAEESIVSMLEETAARRDVDLDLEVIDRSQPVELDDATIDMLDDIVASLDAAHRVMPSGGGHDAMNFQHVGVPAGLVFVPSVDGISHNPRERTTERAIQVGTATLARALLRGPPGTTADTSRVHGDPTPDSA